jgi:hypothetical protein
LFSELTLLEFVVDEFLHRHMGKFWDKITGRLVMFFEHEDSQLAKRNQLANRFRCKARVNFAFSGVSALSEPGEWRN